MLAASFSLVLAIIGAALWRDQGAAPWICAAMVAQAIPFHLAQAGGVAIAVTWLLATLLILLDLGPIGLRIVRRPDTLGAT